MKSTRTEENIKNLEEDNDINQTDDLRSEITK